MLSEEEKKELKELAGSSPLREDMRRLVKTRHNPFVTNGTVDIDKVVFFLTEYNRFINHAQRPFSQIIDKDMKL